MWATLRDLRLVMGSQQFWSTTLRLAILVSLGVAILLIAFTALIVLIPVALIGGVALHLYIRRKLRQAQRQSSDIVIDAEYRVIDRR